MVKFGVGAVAGHSAILLNALLIWLIWKKSGKQLASYRKILYLGAIFDFIFSVVIILTAPIVVLTSNGLWYFIIVEGWSGYIGHPIDFLLIVLNVYLSYSTMTVATLQYVYRFFLICWNITLETKAFSALVVLALFIPTYTIYVWYICFDPKPDEMEFYAPILFETGRIEPKNLISFLVSSRPKTKLITPFSAGLSIGSFGVIVMCSVAVIYKLWRHRKSFAVADRKIQSQISFVLFCEAMIPLLTMVIPIQFLSFFNGIFPWFPSLFNYITALSPLFNPIAKMLIISPFRKTIFRPFWRKNTPPTLVFTIKTASVAVV